VTCWGFHIFYAICSQMWVCQTFVSAALHATGRFLIPFPATSWVTTTSAVRPEELYRPENLSGGSRVPQPTTCVTAYSEMYQECAFPSVRSKVRMLAFLPLLSPYSRGPLLVTTAHVSRRTTSTRSKEGGVTGPALTLWVIVNTSACLHPYLSTIPHSPPWLPRWNIAFQICYAFLITSMQLTSNVKCYKWKYVYGSAVGWGTEL
jgi:hypothetical protein